MNPISQPPRQIALADGVQQPLVMLTCQIIADYAKSLMALADTPDTVVPDDYLEALPAELKTIAEAKIRAYLKTCNGDRAKLEALAKMNDVVGRTIGMVMAANAQAAATIFGGKATDKLIDKLAVEILDDGENPTSVELSDGSHIQAYTCKGDITIQAGIKPEDLDECYRKFRPAEYTFDWEAISKAMLAGMKIEGVTIERHRHVTVLPPGVSPDSLETQQGGSSDEAERPCIH